MAPKPSFCFSGARPGKVTSPYAYPYAHSADRRLRPLHGEPRLDGPFHLPAGHRRRPARFPHLAQTGADELSPEPRGVRSHQRLGRRQIRRANGLHGRDRGFHGRLGSLQPRTEPAGACTLPYRPGPGRRHDGSGRPPRHLEKRRQVRDDRGTRVAHDSGAAGAGDRAAAWRVHHDLPALALDLLHQSAHRRAGPRPHLELHNQRQGGPRAAARQDRLCPFRPGPFRLRLWPRNPGRDGRLAFRRLCLGGSGPWPLRRLCLARQAHRKPGDRSQPAEDFRPSGPASWAPRSSGSGWAPSPFFCRSCCS